MSYSRNNRDRGSGQRRPREDREMHDVVCSKCEKNAQVPFKPDGERPVFCQDCYREQRPQRNTRY
ncbi:MAG: CxxC-x17-CxxC domain-containing protein [Candidatus Kariarchaeaceae archaeon]|jgi:CxxC-x17-CxxC domain-containing protein